MNQQNYQKSARVYAIISIILILASFLNFYIAIFGFIFALISYNQGEKRLGTVCMLLSILYLGTISGLDTYARDELGDDRYEEIVGADVYGAVINIYK